MGNDWGMLGKGLLQDLAIAVIVFQRADLLDATKALEGSVVELVDVGEVRVRNDDVGEGLDVT